MAGFDVHQHLWPRSFVEALSQRTEAPYLDGDTLHHKEGPYVVDLGENELETRLALLDRCEIDTAIVSLQPTFGFEDVDAAERAHLEGLWEEGILEIAAAASGRIVPLAVDRPRPGFAGVTVGADRLEDLDTLGPTLDALRGDGFLFVHPVSGSPPSWAPGWWPAIAEYTGQMQRAYLAWLGYLQERWPDVNVVFAVLAGGGPVQLERLASRGVDVRSTLHQNLYFDTASYGRRAIELCIETFGVGQLVYGSDLPVIDPEPTAQALKGMGESVETLIRLDNPNRLVA